MVALRGVRVAVAAFEVSLDEPLAHHEWDPVGVTGLPCHAVQLHVVRHVATGNCGHPLLARDFWQEPHLSREWGGVWHGHVVPRAGSKVGVKVHAWI